MRVLICAGNKTVNIKNSIDKKYKDSAIDIITINDAFEINELMDKGEYFDRAIIIDKAFKMNSGAVNEEDLSFNIGKFMQYASSKYPSAEYIFVSESKEIADYIYNEKLMLDSAIVILEQDKNKFTVGFFKELISDSMSNLEDRMAYVIEPIVNDDVTDKKFEYETKITEELLGLKGIGTEINTVQDVELNDEDVIDAKVIDSDSDVDDFDDFLESEEEEYTGEYENNTDDIFGLDDFDNLEEPSVEEVTETEKEELEVEEDTEPETEEPEELEVEELEVEEEADFGYMDEMEEETNDSIEEVEEYDNVETEPVEEVMEESEEVEEQHEEIFDNVEEVIESVDAPEDYNTEASKSLDAEIKKVEETVKRIVDNDVTDDDAISDAVGATIKASSRLFETTYSHKDEVSTSNKKEVNLDEKLSRILHMYKTKGCSIIVTGAHGAGKTSIAHNMAKFFNTSGLNVLIVDLDMWGRGMAYISDRAYESVHHKNFCGVSLLSAINCESGNIADKVDLVEPGLYVATLGLGGDIAEPDIIKGDGRLGSFNSMAKSIYNVTIYDIPLENIESYKELVYSVDNIMVVAEGNTHGAMNTIIGMGNIDDERLQRILYELGNICYNRIKKETYIFGEKMMSVKDIAFKMDERVSEIIGCSPDYTFYNMKICGVVYENDAYDKNYSTNKCVIDNEKNREEYKKIIMRLLVDEV